ncbi:sigma-54 interaction domain-containing protein [Polyangium fumosum]|uniref:sigma-54 interaction domain-containing protein n=1 Tax=Polyangium fumosum TaxID=889272 RepID=UPI001B877CED|nr:sigma 54-interacting transcriptional regulator [Polyangium fumosum]
MPRKPPATSTEAVIVGALEAASGAALVLDEDLRIVLSTPAAAELLGVDIPPHASAPKLLCGENEKRPVAEALAEGRPVQAVLPPRGPGRRLVRVRSLPVTRGRARVGTLLLLDDAGESFKEGEVLFHGMWTQDPAMKAMFRVLERVAGDDVTVLVRGETGSGKELVASAIHELSGRRKGPFRAINCAALPSHLLESELFGHARGAFTGAVRDTPGHVQLAHRGTLFLDEVAEMPLELQAKLLRVVETRTVIPVGAREPIPVDVRFVSATHRSLRKEVEAGRFRADLMYRLRVIPVFIPSLRERPDDIPLLVEKFMEQRNEASRRRIERVAPAAMTILRRYAWPGNVRELKNVLAYAYAMGDGSTLVAADLPPELVDPNLFGAEQVVPSPTPEVSAEHANPEARRILEVLDRTGGNRQRAAQILGMSRVTLWRRIRELNLVGTA